MCGIVGYIGDPKWYPHLLTSLQRLEYRGYDSAGVTCVKDGNFITHKTTRQISTLREIHDVTDASRGISHTRWATHGQPSEENAHPHFDCGKTIAIVHNGIVENYQELKRRLEEKGHTFTSETDTETLVHLIEEELSQLTVQSPQANKEHEKKNSPPEVKTFLIALKKAFAKVRGTYAVAVLHRDLNALFGVRNQSPLVVGLGQGRNILASDVTAILEHTSRVVYLEDNQYVYLNKEKVEIYREEDISEDPGDRDTLPIEYVPHDIPWSLEEAEKGGFEHFMQKEIFEQPRSLHQVILGKLSVEDILEYSSIPPPDRIKVLACGTSYHAGLVGKYMMEELAGIPVTVEYASEYRYSAPTKEGCTVIGISQSGETADTLAALREAKNRGSTTLAITNVVGSTITREVDEVLYMSAGPEIGVAATKSFLNTLMVLYFFSLRCGVMKKSISSQECKQYLEEARDIPKQVREVLNKHEEIKRAAAKYSSFENCFFIGRHIHYPSALEGALKLKEISYIHAEAFAAGEIKHGPLALVEKKTPVIAIMTEGHVFEKTLSNVKEISARGAPVIGVSDAPELIDEGVVDYLISVPKTSTLLSPLVVSVSLQLYAYFAASIRGCPIDKPRNLAKSVTVE